jgi:hypothetical protein
MFSHASVKVAKISKQLLEREGKREYLLGLVDRKRTCHGDLLFFGATGAETPRNLMNAVPKRSASTKLN